MSPWKGLTLAAALLLPPPAAAEDFSVQMPALRFEKTIDLPKNAVKPPKMMEVSSKLYLRLSTENPYFKETKNRELLKKDVAAIYAGNPDTAVRGLAKEVVLLADDSALTSAAAGFGFTDGVVELTDEYFGFNSSLGTTLNCFYAKIYVGKGTKIGGSGPGAFPGQTNYYPGAYNYAYGVAHEFLHQLVAKAGYLLHSNYSQYVYEDAHLSDGGLLTEGGDERLWNGPSSQNVLNRPATPGTGIERISDIHLRQIGVAAFVSERASGLSHDRLQTIMGQAGSKDYGF